MVNRVTDFQVVTLAFFALFTVFNAQAFAQTAPDAGRILRESAPPQGLDQPSPAPILPKPETEPTPGRPAQAGPVTTFVLRELRFEGNIVYSDEALAALGADKIGQKVTFADLEEIIRRITEQYRAAGYLLAQAVLAPQDVSNGAVELSIIEGTLGQVRVERAPEAPISDDRVRKTLSGIEAGKPLQRRNLERSMLLLSDLPGVAVQSSLEASAEPGSSDLIIEVNPTRRWDFAVAADNYGSRATGEYRLGALGRIKSPFRRGDNLDLRALVSSEGGVVYGRAAYESPLGYTGTRGGFAVSRVDYELGRQFSALDATGEADVFELFVTHPIIRSRARNLLGRFGYEHKRLEDNIGALAITTDKRVRNLVGGLAYEMRDGFFGGGYTSADLTAYFGDLDIFSADALAADRSAAGRRTEGRYERVSYQISRLQALTERTSVFLGLAGQLASKNLDSAEKIAIGGPNAVRAYPVSEGIADEGHVLNAEYRYSFTPALTVSGFYDIGHARFNNSPLPIDGDNSRTLRGVGAAVFWVPGAGFVVRASLAWRDSGRTLSEDRDRNPRLFAQVSKSF